MLCFDFRALGKLFNNNNRATTFVTIQFMDERNQIETVPDR